MPKTYKSEAITKTVNGIRIAVSGKNVGLTNTDLANILISREINKLKKQILQYNKDPNDIIANIKSVINLPEKVDTKVKIPKTLQAEIEKSPEFHAKKIKIDEVKKVVTEIHKADKLKIKTEKAAAKKAAKPKRVKMTPEEKKAKAKAKYDAKRNAILLERARRVLQRLKDQLDFDDSLYEKIINVIKTLVRRKGNSENIDAETVIKAVEDALKVNIRVDYSKYIREEPPEIAGNL